MARPLHDALEETLGFIQRALDRIVAGEGVEAELHNVRAYLVNILELVERDPGIEAASDDLYAVAKELARGVDQGTRMSGLLVTGSPPPGQVSKREPWASLQHDNGHPDQTRPEAIGMGAIQTCTAGEGAFLDHRTRRECPG